MNMTNAELTVLGESIQEILVIREMCEQNNATIDELKKMLSIKENRIAELEKEIDLMQTENNDLRAENASLLNANTEYKADAENAIKELEMLRTKGNK